MKGYTSIVHNVVAAGLGGNPLAAAFATMTSGQTSELVLSEAQWPTDGSRINYQTQTANGKWDATNNKLYLYNKRSGAATGALHVYDAATGLWAQAWTGYPSSPDGISNTFGNCYNTWSISPSDQKILFADYYGHIRRWDAQSTTAFTDLFSLIVSPFANTATQGTTPYSVEFLTDGYGSGQEGLLVATPKRLYLTKRDASTASILWSADTGQSIGYVSLHRPATPVQKIVYMVGGPGYAKTGSVYNSAEARATLEVPVYRINGSVVERVQDAPSANVGPSNTNYDRVCCYGNSTMYLFEGDGSGIWQMTIDNFGFTAWTKLPHTHNFKTVGANVPFNVTPIPEYGGIVGISSSSTSSSAYSSRIRMFLYKV